MKRLFILLVIGLFIIQVSGQDLKTEIDPYTGIKTKSTDYVTMGTVGKTGTIKFKLTQWIGKDTTLRLYIFVNRVSIRCLDENSRVQINYGDGVVSLKLVEEKHCGSRLEDYAILTPDNIKKLKNNRIGGIRVNYTRDYEDFKLFERGGFNDQSDYFMRLLKLFE